MTVRKFFSLFLSVCLIAALFSGCGGSSASSGSEHKTIVIGTQEMPNTEGIAKQLGYFEEAFGALGYDVNIVDFSSGAKVNAALLSGDIDFALIGTCPVANGLANGVDCKVIWIHSVLGAVESLAVKDSAGIETVTDLVGKTVATPFASTAHYSLLMAMKSFDVDAASVDLIDMQPAEINAAWANGQIDAAYVWEPTLTELLTDGHILLTSNDVAGYGYMTADLAVVRTEFAEQHPELVEVYVDCLNRAALLYQQQPEDAVAAIAAKLEISAEDAAAQMAGNIWLNAAEQQTQYFENDLLGRTLYDTAQFLLEQGSITTLPDEQAFLDAVDGTAIAAVAAEQ